MISKKMSYHPRLIEKKWQELWEKEKLFFDVPDFSKKKKFYALVEFPYPSGDGLHVGHAFTFILMDIFSRKKRMEGKNVLHPMGWDAFGLPTENYALKTGLHPTIVTKANTDNFRAQMKALALSYNWQREINTTAPDYYYWTQWIFLQLFKRGLAYKKEMDINWCPACKIGLANEEVVEGGCERCGQRVTKKRLSQWLLKITLYADRLADELNLVDYPQSVVASQRNWIGRSEGLEIDFPLADGKDKVSVFTTRPDTIFGTTFLILAPEHPLAKNVAKPLYQKRVNSYIEQAQEKMELDRLILGKEKTGVFTGSYGLNPISGERVPIFLADFVVVSYGTGAAMGVPAHDKRDFQFAKKYNLAIVEVIKPEKKQPPEQTTAVIWNSRQQEPFTGEGTLINSGRFDGLDSSRARVRISQYLTKKGLARKSVQYHLRDWIFSRQHYWGEPIPLIYCQNCAKKEIGFWDTKEARGSKIKGFEVDEDTKKELVGWFPVPEKDLPIELPEIKKYEPSGTGQSPLATLKSFVQAICPVCGQKAQRETDTMPNWAGSSWYYLRYCDPKNKKNFASAKSLRYWLPVDLYLGGAEHNTLHLLYSRFWHKFLNDQGLVPGKEPYAKRRGHGIILGEDGQKMSKSRGNVIVPETMVERFGADSLRLYLAFIGPYDGTFPWSTAGIKGTRRFLERFWRFFEKAGQKGSKKSDKRAKALLHRLIREVGQDIDQFKFNTACAKIMQFLNEVEKKEMSLSDLAKALLVLAPFAPYLAEELWQKYIALPAKKFLYRKLKVSDTSRGGSGELGVPPCWKTGSEATARNRRCLENIAPSEARPMFSASHSIHNQAWPKFSNKLARAKTIDLIIQVNGKVRDKIRVAAGIPKRQAEKLALSSPKIKSRLGSQKPKKIIFVPEKIVNIVI